MTSGHRRLPGGRVVRVARLSRGYGIVAAFGHLYGNRLKLIEPAAVLQS